jgi:uncharacterized membrane protein YgcG
MKVQSRRDTVKRIPAVLAVLAFILCSSPIFALDRNVIDDVVKMTKAGVSDESIVTFVQAVKDDFEVTADDVIKLTEAGASKNVIKALVEQASLNENEGDVREKKDDDGDRRVYVAPYPYWPGRYWDPFYDPYWYQPRFSIGIRLGHIGGGRGHGGGHGGGHSGGRPGGGHSGGGHGRH